MKEYNLLLNTVFKNGNVLILCDNVVVDSAQFIDGELKSDHILTMISSLITKNKIERSSIKGILLAVSGKSLTQSRIVKSIGLGLKDALNVPLRIISEEELIPIFEGNKIIRPSASDNVTNNSVE